MKMISRRSFMKGAGVAAVSVAAASLTGCGSAASSSAASSAASVAGDDYSDILSEFDAAAAALDDWQGTYDALIDQIYVEADLAQREALMHEAEDLLMGTWGVLPIYFYVNLYLQKQYITDVINTPFGMKYFMYAHNTETNDASMNLCLASEPTYLDPAMSNTVDGGCMAANLFAGLMTTNKEGKTDLALAESYEVSADGFTYTFKLLPDQKWSDGEKLDANDFVYSWNRAAAAETASDYGYLFDIMTRDADGNLPVYASEDGQTLTVTLSSVCPYFLDLCAFSTFMPVPQKYVEAANTDGTNPSAWTQEGKFVTNGAYTCESWSHKESITLKKNPSFYDAANVTLDELHFMLSDNDTSIYSAYQAGDLDFSSSIPTDELAGLKEAKAASEAEGKVGELHIDPYLGTYYVGANVDSKLFAEMSNQQACAVRKALTMAIDREYIIENIAQGGQVPANAFVSDGCSDGHGGLYRANDADYSYPCADALGYFDPAADNEQEIITLFKAAGVEMSDDGKVLDGRMDFEYLVNTTSGNVKIGEAIQQDMAYYGITVTITQEEWAVFTEDRHNGNYDIARQGWVMDFNDPINELEMWKSTSGNNDSQFGKRSV